MGCDIHLAVEVRRNGKWERALPPVHARDPYYAKEAAQGSGTWAARHAEVEWYCDRNYRVFAVLADVRNTGEIVPIAEARGLPDDMSDEVARLDYEHPEHDADSDDVSLGDHSQSWLTLAELQAYPWDGEAARTGVVTLDQFTARIVKHGADFPVHVDKTPYDTWCGMTAGPNIVTRAAPDVLKALANGGLKTAPSERTHVEDQWVTSVRAQAGAFTERVLPALAELGAPEDVRIVFGFDS